MKEGGRSKGKREGRTNLTEEKREAKRTGRKEKGTEKNETQCQGEKRPKEDWAGKQKLNLLSLSKLHCSTQTFIVTSLINHEHVVN